MEATYSKVATILDSCPLLIPEEYLRSDIVSGASRYRNKKKEMKTDMRTVEAELKDLENARKQQALLKQLQLALRYIRNEDEADRETVEHTILTLPNRELASLLLDKYRATVQDDNKNIVWTPYCNHTHSVPADSYYASLLHQLKSAIQFNASKTSFDTDTVKSTSIQYSPSASKLVRLQLNPHVFPTCLVSRMVVDLVIQLHAMICDDDFQKSCAGTVGHEVSTLILLYPSLVPTIVESVGNDVSKVIIHSINLLYLGVHCKLLSNHVNFSIDDEINVIQSLAVKYVKQATDILLSPTIKTLKSTRERIRESTTERIDLFQNTVTAVVQQTRDATEKLKRTMPFPLYKEMMSDICSEILCWSCDTVSEMKNLSPSECSMLVEVLSYFQIFEGWFINTEDDLSSLNEATSAARSCCSAFTRCDDLISKLAEMMNGVSTTNEGSSEVATVVFSALNRLSDAGIQHIGKVATSAKR